jgi:hypothetical protein
MNTTPDPAATQAKPCPFCGCADIQFRDCDADKQPGSIWCGKPRREAICLNCFACSGPEIQEADALKLWNTRAEPKDERGEEQPTCQCGHLRCFHRLVGVNEAGSCAMCGCEKCCEPTPPAEPGEGVALLPCRACGGKCRPRQFDGLTLWLCEKNELFGGNCEDRTAYLTLEAWNTRAPAQPAAPVGEAESPPTLTEWDIASVWGVNSQPSGRVFNLDVQMVNACIAAAFRKRPFPTPPAEPVSEAAREAAVWRVKRTAREIAELWEDTARGPVFHGFAVDIQSAEWLRDAHNTALAAERERAEKAERERDKARTELKQISEAFDRNPESGVSAALRARLAASEAARESAKEKCLELLSLCCTY